MTTQVYLIKPEDVQDLWFGIRPILEKALVHSEGALLSSDVLKNVLNEEMQLWAGFDGTAVATAMTTEIVTYPRHKVLSVHTWATASGYDFDIWYPEVMKALEGFGRYHDCTGLEAYCRKGLARKLDWENEYSVITRPLTQKME